MTNNARDDLKKSRDHLTKTTDEGKIELEEKELERVTAGLWGQARK
jgi:hypothetical protein